MSPMPSRRRPKSSPAPQASTQLSDAQRFAQSLRDSEEADRRAKQAAVDAKNEAERQKVEAQEEAARLKRAQEAHQRAVEQVKEAKRTGKGRAEADAAWRDAKAELVELETGKRPAWAAQPPEPTPAADEQDDTGASDDTADTADTAEVD
jgi:membrane protein involved in colicin uptake